MIEPTAEMRAAFRAAHDAARSDDGFHFKEDADIEDDAGIAAVLALVERDHMAETGVLRGLLGELVDPDDCQLDHHGYCQAHSLDPAPCPHARAKAVLANPTP